MLIKYPLPIQDGRQKSKMVATKFSFSTFQHQTAVISRASSRSPCLLYFHFIINKHNQLWWTAQSVQIVSMSDIETNISLYSQICFIYNLQHVSLKLSLHFLHRQQLNIQYDSHLLFDIINSQTLFFPLCLQQAVNNLPY